MECRQNQGLLSSRFANRGRRDRPHCYANSGNMSWWDGDGGGGGRGGSRK